MTFETDYTIELFNDTEFNFGCLLKPKSAGYNN